MTGPAALIPPGTGLSAARKARPQRVACAVHPAGFFRVPVATGGG